MDELCVFCRSSCYHWLHLISTPTCIQQNASSSWFCLFSAVSRHHFILLSQLAEFRYWAPLSTNARLVSLPPNCPLHPFYPLCLYDHVFILLPLYLASALHQCQLGNIHFFLLKCKLLESLRAIYICVLVS